MGCPPNPGLRSLLLLVAAAKLGWRSLGRVVGGRELGTLVDARGLEHHLVVAAGDQPGVCVWALLEGGERPAMAYSMTRETLEALQSATVAEDGGALVAGRVMWLGAGWDGVAELASGDCSTNATT